MDDNSTMRGIMKRSVNGFFLPSSEIIFSFLIKMSTLKAIKIESAFFIPLRNPWVTRLVISFVLEISVINSPINLVISIFIS